MLDEMHHVALPVTDLPASVRWYRYAFRVEVLYEDETWALLGFANTRLALVRPEQHPAHIAVERTDAERFGALRAHRDGSRSIYLDDPAGNAVEGVAVPLTPSGSA